MLSYSIARKALAIMLATTACAGAVSAGNEEQAPAGPWVTVARGDGFGIFELRATGPESRSWDALRYCDVENAGGRPAVQEWRDVAAFHRTTGGKLKIAALHLSSGKWAVVQTELAGGTRVLQFVVLGHELPTGQPPPLPGAPQLIARVRLAGQASDEQPAVVDLGNPRIIERAGDVYLIAESGEYQQRWRYERDPVVTWIAPATPEDAQKSVAVLPNGRIIGKGRQPRVVSWNDRFVVTTQVEQPGVDAAWGKTVKVYEGADLETWRPMTAPDAALEFFGYELTVARGKLTLVGVVDTSERAKRPERVGREYEPPLALVTLTYDAGKGAWQETSRRTDSTLTTESEVKLLPTELTGGALKLIRRETDGTYTVSPVAE